MNKYSNKIKLQLDGDTLDKTQDDFEVIDYYPQLKLVKNCDYYAKKYQDYFFCYNYAFKTIHLDDVSEAFHILLHEYNPITKQNARLGDILSFHNIRQGDGRIYKTPNDINAEHFAVISYIEGKNIKIKSKFGILGVFEGDIKDLPKSYGNTFVIWRKNKISPTTKTIC